MRKAWFWIIAGVNGAGKTSLARKLESRRLLSSSSMFPDEATAGSALWLNPDRRAKELLAEDPECGSTVANARAVLDIESQVDQRIEQRKTVIVETVLSSNKYKRRVELAQAAGMGVGMIYVGLSSVELAILRVRDRVAQGGHDVPEEKIRSRWFRSLTNLTWFAEHADYMFVYSNDRAGGSPNLVAVVRQGHVVQMDDDCLPEVARLLRTLRHV